MLGFSMFDTSEELENVYFSFQSFDDGDDEHFEGKKYELSKWKIFKGTVMQIM